MKRLMTILLLIAASSLLYGQDLTSPDNESQSSKLAIQKNSVYVEFIPVFFLSGFYERTTPLSGKLALTTGIGVMQGLWENATDLPFKFSFFYGKKTHFIECGSLINIIRDKKPKSDLGTFIPHLNYRYQGEKGLLLRAGLLVNLVKDYSDSRGKEILETQPGLGLTLGYSF